MDLKFTTVRGQKIAYLDKNNESTKTLFFIHGNSGSSRLWLKQFENPAFDPFRLIAPDLPAHGDSPGFGDNLKDYNCIVLGQFLVDFIRHLGLEDNIILVGYSLGANLIAEMVDMDLTPAGMVLEGSSVVGAACTPDVVLYEGGATNILFMETCPVETVRTFYNEQVSASPDTGFKEKMIEDYFRTDIQFRHNFFQNSINGMISDGIDNLQKSGIPALALFGEEDRLINIDYLDHAGLNLWNNQVYKIPLSGHSVNVDRPEIFDELVLKYCAERFK